MLAAMQQPLAGRQSGDRPARQHQCARAGASVGSGPAHASAASLVAAGRGEGRASLAFQSSATALAQSLPEKTAPSMEAR